MFIGGIALQATDSLRRVEDSDAFLLAETAAMGGVLYVVCAKQQFATRSSIG